MRRLIVSNLMSLDGFVAGPKGELDWFVHEGFMIGTEFGQYAREMISSVDAILLGRLTYQEFVGYWPTATDNDPVITERINSLPKIIFSKTLERVEWNNARLVKGNAADEVRRLKEQPGRDLVIYGSAELVSALMKENLIDEFHIIIQPVVLGKGKPEFKDLNQRHNLKLVEAKPFKSGAVWLRYQPA
ncbi:MAG TPA: dihydrofolate reductase family protein [Candidatus Bathyarchaeia archaeon]|nr:dihydrofolate reductase family protein [Candidatus Bathyarchaeia archaeon]